MNFFKWFYKLFICKKYSVSILNKQWQPIKEIIKLKYIPRFGELIFLEDIGKYYEVLNVVYYLNDKQGIFLIVDELEDKIPNRTIKIKKN